MAQYFNLTLDTAAPSNGIISGLQSYYNSDATITLNANGAAFMKVWTNNSASGTTTDTTYPGAWETYNTSKTVTFSEQGTQYVHAQFMDNVGNIGIIVDSSATIYDTTAPTISNISINNNEGYTKNASNTVRITFSDATSGVASVTLAGNIAVAEQISYTLTDADRTAGYKDIAVTFASPDGIKTVSATAIDRAGNTCTAVSDTIMYDSTPASITVLVRKEDDSVNLPAFVNYRDYGVRIVTEDTDITHYKIWEGNTEPNDWTAISNATEVSGIGYFINGLQLSTGDGLKTIHVKVQDIAGNVTTGTALTTTLDTVAPVATLSSNKSVIGPNSGYNTVTFTINATDTNSVQGLTYYLKTEQAIDEELGNLATGSLINGTTTVDINYNTLTALDGGLDGGIYDIYVQVIDVAENEGSSSILQITCDGVGPTGSVTTDTYYNTTTINITVEASDIGGAGMDKMKVWLDSTEPSTWDSYVDGTVTFTGVTEGQHIAHAKFMDSVGNVSETYDSDTFIVDTTAPTGTISGPTYTNTRSVTITITASDDKSGIVTSGLAQMKVWENGTTEPEWESYTGTKSLTLTNGDGNKTIKAKFKDNAGNVSVETSYSIILDTDEPDVTLVLTKTDRTTILPSTVSARGFNARIGFTNETQESAIIEYKLTGDFSESSDNWQTFTADTGQSYMTISGLTFTASNGQKVITALLKDAAGNISPTGASVSILYDSSNPVIDVNAPDYNIISKQHTARLNSAGSVVTGKYNDTCIFTWSSNKPLQAFKICVNQPGQTASGATAIGTTNGSQNMSGSIVAANTDITSVIMGLDFAATNAVNDTDGAYEIIVYGQDEGGNWSDIHVLDNGSSNEPV